MVDKVGISMLRYSGIDVDGALARFCNNSALYEEYIKKFIVDETFAKMVEDIKEKNFEEGYKGCHALKGVTGNLGFTDLFASLDVLCKALRSGVPAPIVEACEISQKEYEDVIKIIKEL